MPVLQKRPSSMGLRTDCTCTRSFFHFMYPVLLSLLLLIISHQMNPILCYPIHLSGLNILGFEIICALNFYFFVLCFQPFICAKYQWTVLPSFTGLSGITSKRVSITPAFCWQTVFPNIISLFCCVGWTQVISDIWTIVGTISWRVDSFLVILVQYSMLHLLSNLETKQQ